VSSEDRVFTLYRFFDAESTLLYVGQTVNARARLRNHERKKDWFPSVTKITTERFPDAETLTAAETAAIRNEKPAHNVAHNRAARREVKNASWMQDEDAAFIIDRILSMGLDDVEPPCEYPDTDTDHDCLGCIRAVLLEIQHLKDKWCFDWNFTDEVKEIETAYRYGKSGLEATEGLSDALLFRRFRLSGWSSECDPAPAFAEVCDHALEVACPFCGERHTYLFQFGDELRPIKTSCVTGRDGWLIPVFDHVDSTGMFAIWAVRRNTETRTEMLGGTA